jgi:hypothetical protein
MPDDVLGTASADVASATPEPGLAPSGSSGQEETDDYQDLAGDPRIQKYVSDLHSKALKDIPKEYRDGGKFKELLGHSQRLRDLEANPGFQAFLAGQQASRGGPAQPAAPKTLAEAINAGLSKRFGLGDQHVEMLSGYGDLLMERLMQEIQSKHIDPIRQYLADQKYGGEYEAASKLPGFQDALPKIKEVMQRYDNRISFEDAYRIAIHDDLSKRSQAPAAAGIEGIEEGQDRIRRAKSGERPTGHGAGDVSLKRAKSRDDSKANARRRLAAQGITVDEG